MDPALADLRIQEIRSLMAKTEPGPRNGSSFTALLGLPSAQAMELLHEAGAGRTRQLISPSAAAAAAADVWRGQKFPLDDFAFGCFPTFPSNLELVDRAARFSVFAAEESSFSPQTTSSNSGLYSAKGAVKTEPADSDSNANSSAGSKPPPPPPPPRRPARRKQQEKGKAKGTAKRARTSTEDSVRAAAENNGGETEKLPYVHVRARRGQATDSHSLAERARREKINARMKLLQELVPGCHKICGTAQVLDEIINHVQSLQRQVEFLSMRLATVNPGVDFGGIDSFFAESGRMQEASAGGAAGMEQLPLWSDAHRRQQIWLADLLPSPQSPPTFFWGRDDAEHHHHHHHGLVPPTSSPFEYDAVNTVPLRANQLKQEI